MAGRLPACSLRAGCCEGLQQHRTPTAAAAVCNPLTCILLQGPVRNIDVGNKTETLAEAAMRGELDESEASYGGEAGAGSAAKPAKDAELEPQFATGTQ